MMLLGIPLRVMMMLMVCEVTEVAGRYIGNQPIGRRIHETGEGGRVLALVLQLGGARAEHVRVFHVQRLIQKAGRKIISAWGCLCIVAVVRWQISTITHLILIPARA